MHRQREALAVLIGLVLSAALLNACSVDLSGTHAHSASLAHSAPAALSMTLRSEGAATLATFQRWMTLMQQNGGAIASYQREYTRDQQALENAHTETAYTTALRTLQAQTRALALPAMRQECLHLQQALQQQVNAWGAQHTFHDTYNNTTYKLGYEYDNGNGIGGSAWVQGEIHADASLADYQQTVQDLNTWLFNFQEMQANFSDTTPANQSHQADLDLLRHYGDTSGRAVVVSLSEQEMRVYDHGQLVRAFPVTTGQPNLPSVPGAWQIGSKLHPTIFKAGVPKSSPHWYPDTLIYYAMQYHSNGYFLHDAWWRTQFGPGTNFPHHDTGGNPFSDEGSHGCINMAKSNAAWLYAFVAAGTPVIVY